MLRVDIYIPVIHQCVPSHKVKRESKHESVNVHTEKGRNQQIANLFLQNANHFPPHALMFVVCVCVCVCVCVWQALWISKVTLQGRLQLLYKRKRVCVLLRRDTLWSDLSWDGLNVMIQCSIPSLKRKTEKLVFNVSGLFDVYESRYLHNGWSEEGERKQLLQRDRNPAQL